MKFLEHTGLTPLITDTSVEPIFFETMFAGEVLRLGSISHVVLAEGLSKIAKLKR
jgi:hypothetical protein